VFQAGFFSKSYTCLTEKPLGSLTNKEVFMDRIRSMKDLEKAKDEALQKERERAQKNRFQIRVSLGSCGIAVGARETFDAMEQLIVQKEAGGVQLKKVGCIGLCALEPVVQIFEAGRPQITYGKVTPAVVQRIFAEHIEKGLIVQEYVVENI
jgi:NADP-reducing hydrogenase subunit HndB